MTTLPSRKSLSIYHPLPASNAYNQIAGIVVFLGDAYIKTTGQVGKRARIRCVQIMETT